MKEKKKKSAVGRLYNTFGTILLLSVFAVCTINFARDGRVFEMPLLSAVAKTQAAQATAGAVKESDNFTTIKYKKSETPSSSKSSSSKGKSASKATVTPVPQKQPPVADP